LEVNRCDELCAADCGGLDCDDAAEVVPKGHQRKPDTSKDGGGRSTSGQYDSDSDHIVPTKPISNKDSPAVIKSTVSQTHFKFQRGDQYEVQFDSDSDCTLPFSDSDDC
jgi:hypothetical protein